MFEDVLTFWFQDTDPKLWWTSNTGFDNHIRQRFSSLLTSAAQGELYPWRENPKGRLAEIIVLDQFSRNIYRNSAQAFSQDPLALALSQEAVAADVFNHYTATEIGFLLTPYMHSESKIIHSAAVTLYQTYAAPDNYQFELRHKAIIDRFGRYPHRNSVLGRTSTSEEVEFLKQPGSRF